MELPNSSLPKRDEKLVNEIEEWHERYLVEVEKYFKDDDEAMGKAALIAWEQHFIQYLEDTAPKILQFYRTSVSNIPAKSKLAMFSIYQNWTRGKGGAVNAFFTQVLIDAQAGRLQKEIKQNEELPSPTNLDSQNEPGKIFIGHGNSPQWKELKDFLRDRLHLTWDEFNRIPVAGISTVKRLEDMLKDARFAFIILTAEDTHPDGTMHARENVVHEAGLFQGKLGFQKAILLVEDECEEFSNIKGLTQIRFRKGTITTIFEEIRKVLEREGIITRT